MVRLKRYSSKQIRRALAKYELLELSVRVAADMEIRMVAVEDAYVLLDRLIEQEQQEQQQRVERFPYWAEIWPASVALARWFCQDPAHVPGGDVLELGCGLGLVGIALARLGIRVEATDFVEDALLFASHNAELNGVPGRFRVGYLDWSNPVGATSDCLVAADIIYERKNHPYLARLLRALLAPGGWFYTSDPCRESARRFVQALIDQGYEHEVERVELAWKSITHRVDVHAFRKPDGLSGAGVQPPRA